MTDKLKLENILSCINSEAKNLALLHLDSEPIGPTILRNNIAETLGREDNLPQKSSFKQYCLCSFLPAGLIEVIQEEQEKRTVQKYCLTPNGLIYGQSIGAFALKYAVENNLSLTSLFGTSPEVRLRLIETLDQEREKRLGRPELMELVRVDHPSLLLHMRKLADLGFLKYESIGQSASEGVKYCLTEKNPDTLQVQGNRGKTMKVIVDKLKEIEEGTYQDIAESMGREDRPHIHSSLKTLKDRGYITESRWVHEDYESEAKVLPYTKVFLDTFVKPVREALQDEQALKNIQQAYNDFMKSPEMFRCYANRAMSLHNNASNNIKAMRRI